MKFFKIQSRDGRPDYYAAYSPEHMRKMLGDKNDSRSMLKFCGYLEDTLEEVSLQEAQKAVDFRGFALDGEPCRDGTYLLGPEAAPTDFRSSEFYLMPRTRELN